MINKVGREIPQEILDLTGKKPYMGYLELDNYEYVKSAPKTRAVIDPTRTKLVASIDEALDKCEIKDGMTLSFHHHFREGDYVVNMVMERIYARGNKKSKDMRNQPWQGA